MIIKHGLVVDPASGLSRAYGYTGEERKNCKNRT